MFDLRKFLNEGQNSMISKVVQRSDTAVEYPNELNDLLATPACVHMAIESAIETIDKYLPDGFISVGSSIRFVHTAPTSLGMTVTIRTSIIAIGDHDVLLDIKAWDEQGEIGHGQHRRAIVNKEQLIAKAEERTHFLTKRNS